MSNIINLLDNSDTDDDGDGDVFVSCPSCTLTNPIVASYCEVCNYELFGFNYGSLNEKSIDSLTCGGDSSSSSRNSSNNSGGNISNSNNSSSSGSSNISIGVKRSADNISVLKTTSSTSSTTTSTTTSTSTSTSTRDYFTGDCATYGIISLLQHRLSRDTCIEPPSPSHISSSSSEKSQEESKEGTFKLCCNSFPHIQQRGFEGKEWSCGYRLELIREGEKDKKAVNYR